MQRLTDGVHRLGTGWVNWYLVEVGGSIALLDCGLPGYHDQLGPALQSLGRSPTDVAAIVLTHYHADHVGSAERLRAETGARVHAPAGDAAGVRGEVEVPAPSGIAANLWRPVMLRYAAHTLANGGPKFEPVRELREYRDGEVLDVPGRPRAIHTPGHTGGHCALLLSDAGVLVSGDAMGAAGLLSGRREPEVPPFNEDTERARASIERLAELDAGLVVFGHGEPFRAPPSEAVARAREPR